jgi:hypothetical protein
MWWSGLQQPPEKAIALRCGRLGLEKDVRGARSYRLGKYRFELRAISIGGADDRYRRVQPKYAQRVGNRDLCL